MGNTFYVSATDGNNNQSGNQPDQALRTIQAAINKAQAGDAVYIRGGTYAEKLHIQKPGTAAAPILIAAYENEKPVIDGSNLYVKDDWGLVIVSQSQSITLKGLEIKGSGGRGLLVIKSSQIAIVECEIHACEAGGLQAHESEDVRFERCRVHHCARRFLAGTPALVYTAVATRVCKNILIAENQVYENSGVGISVWTGSEKAVVKNNICYDNRNGQINVTSAVDVTVEANLCYHTGRPEFLTINNRRGSGITKYDIPKYQAGGYWHARDIRIINNIVAGCGTGFENLWNRGKSTSLTFAHNTIVNSSDQGIKLGFEKSSTDTFVENNIIIGAEGSRLAKVQNNVNGIIWRHNLWSTFPGNQVFNPANDIVEQDVGLANLNAPIESGKLTAEPFKLLANSVAIDKGIRNNGAVAVDFWGNKRDGLPDLGASEVPGRSSEEPAAPVVLTPGQRVSDGIVALYEFKEGQGSRVNDSSGVGDALHLRIFDTSKVSWLADGLSIKEPTILSSEKPAKKIIDACKQSNEITIEAWITPSNITQDGPARIVSISKDKMSRNVTLAQGLYGNQPPNLFMTRLRTTWTSNNGLPPVVTPAGSATLDLTHIVYTRSAAGQAITYINGRERAILNIEGKLSNWDASMPLMLVNEMDGDRPWLGELKLVAIYKRALRADEVIHNYTVGQRPGDTPSAQFTIPEGADRGINPHTVEFDSAESVAGNGIASYFWEFGDGQTSSRPNPTYTYKKAGIYTVSLTITDTKGKSDKITKANLIKVANQPFPPMPEEYARFLLVDVTNSGVLAFGIQYPDLRCALLWNRDPFHILLFRRVEDVSEKYGVDGSVDIVWVDQSQTDLDPQPA